MTQMPFDREEDCFVYSFYVHLFYLRSESDSNKCNYYVLVYELFLFVRTVLLKSSNY